MAGVAGEHRPTARLRHVANQKTVPANLFRVLGKLLDEANELRIAPVAVTRRSHDLPGRSGDRQRYGAGEAAIEIAADRARRPGKRCRFAREQFFGRRRRRVRILQRWQRLGIERAGRRRVNQVLFLRDGKLTAARNRTTSRRAAARISNYFLTVDGEQWSAIAPANNTAIDIVTTIAAQLRRDFQRLAMSPWALSGHFNSATGRRDVLKFF